MTPARDKDPSDPMRVFMHAHEERRAQNAGPCAHCGTARRGDASVDGARVCHPDNDVYPDCYRLITVYGEELGSRNVAVAHLNNTRLRAELLLLQKRVDAIHDLTAPK